MSLRRFLTKLADVSSVKEVEACKAAISGQLVEVAKQAPRESKELQGAISQLIDFYAAKHAEFIVDIVSSVHETIAQEFLRQMSERIAASHKELLAYSSGSANVSAAQAAKSFQVLCSLLEFLLKIVSRGPWWNELVISAMSTAFARIVKDPLVDVSCYTAVSYIISICVPYSIAFLDERLMIWLCNVTNTLLNRAFSDAVKAVEQQMAGEALRNSVMQLVLILYGIFPITFLKQLMQSCKPQVVDYVVAQLRLHPILSQHLAAQRADAPLSTALSSSTTANSADGGFNSTSQPQSAQSAATAANTSSNAAVSFEGLSQAECKSKNRFRGKDFSDIVTECLNYEATSPPKLFSADVPSALAAPPAATNPQQPAPPGSLLLLHPAAVRASNELLSEAPTDSAGQAAMSHSHHIIQQHHSHQQTTRHQPASYHAHRQQQQQQNLVNGGLHWPAAPTTAAAAAAASNRLTGAQVHSTDWCHFGGLGSGGDDTLPGGCYYSCPPSPSATRVFEEALAQLAAAAVADGNNQVTSHHHQHQHLKGLVDGGGIAGSGGGHMSLASVNENIRLMLLEHRRRESPSPDVLSPSCNPLLAAAAAAADVQRSPFRAGSHDPNNSSSPIPLQYARCYVKLQQLKSDGAGESELLREQLRLAQLSLGFERWRQLVFVCKNRSLMAEHKKLGELDGLLEDYKRRIHELQSQLDFENEKRMTLEQQLASQAGSGGGLFINVSQPAMSSADLLSADLSPRYRKPSHSVGAQSRIHPSHASTPHLSDLATPNASETIAAASSATTTTTTVLTTPTTATATTDLGKASSTLRLGSDSQQQQQNTVSSASFSSTPAGASSSTGAESMGGDPQAATVPNVVTPALNKARRNEWNDLVRQKEELVVEMGILRQQLRQTQLELLAATSSRGDDTRAEDGGGPESRKNINNIPDRTDEEQSGSGGESVSEADRIELLTQQLSDSRREVLALGELMSEMKSRLDTAEMNRQKLVEELARLSQQQVPGLGTPTTAIHNDGHAKTANTAGSYYHQLMGLQQSPQHFLSPAGAVAVSSPAEAAVAASLVRLHQLHHSPRQQPAPRLEQYPTLKRQVERILLRKQELATSSAPAVVPTPSSVSAVVATAIPAVAAASTTTVSPATTTSIRPAQ